MGLPNHAYLGQRLKLIRQVQSATIAGDSKKEKEARAKLKALELQIQGKQK